MNITEKKRLMEWRGGRERHTASTLTCVPVSGSPSSPFSLLISFRGEFPAPGPKTEARDFPLAPPQRKRVLKKKWVASPGDGRMRIGKRLYFVLPAYKVSPLVSDRNLCFLCLGGEEKWATCTGGSELLSPYVCSTVTEIFVVNQHNLRMYYFFVDF